MHGHRGRPSKVMRQMSDLSKAFNAPPAAASPPPFTETAEFQAAVAAAVAAAIPAIRDQLALEMPRVASSSSDQHFAESLAMSIAQLTDQNDVRIFTQCRAQRVIKRHSVRADFTLVD